MEPPILGRCPWCLRELAVFIDDQNVDISHAEPECERFRQFCEAEGFEVVELADNACESR